MNNDEIKTFEQLTGIAELRRKARRNFHLWTKEQSDRVLFLIELVNREMDKIQRDEHKKRAKAEKKLKGAKMRTFHAARLDAEAKEAEQY
jgi:hypothetical protein